MIKAGELDRQIAILTPTRIEDSFGEHVAAWETLATVRAAKKTLSNRDVMRAQGVVNAPMGKFVIRWLAGVKTNCRVVFDGQHFDIESIEELGRKHGLVIYVVAV